MLLKSCGTVLPSSVTSRGSKMTVLFHTDLSVVRRGFRATWAEVTGGGATEVSCGGHTAASCAECGPWYWCNGDCAWSDGKCRDIVSSFLMRRFFTTVSYLFKVTEVSCGGHYAASCSQCGPNWTYCNGDCFWNDGKCTNRSGP